ncbi:MAG: glutamate dehydrogenase, partial [Thermoplasmata archaeon]
LGVDLAKARVAIQGYGNVGYNAARLFHEEGGSKIVAVSDSRGAIRDKEGLDPLAVKAHKDETGSVAGFPGSEPITPKELLAEKAEVLIPAALSGWITTDNVDSVQARIVAEGANGPTTPGADQVLFQRDVTVIPDILCNAGGVTVSYFEWVQSLQMFFWSLEEVKQRLEEIMVKAFDRVWEMAQEENVDMRTAAYMVAMKKIVRAYEIRGIYP